MKPYREPGERDKPTFATRTSTLFRVVMNAIERFNEATHHFFVLMCLLIVAIAIVLGTGSLIGGCEHERQKKEVVEKFVHETCKEKVILLTDVEKPCESRLHEVQNTNIVTPTGALVFKCACPDRMQELPEESK